MKIPNKLTENDLEKLEQKLFALSSIPSRNPKNAANGKTNYLSEAKLIQSEIVTTNNDLRHRYWKNKQKKVFGIRKEPLPMLTQVVSIILIAVTLLGGIGGGTVYASQSALPDELLYPIKIWAEDFQLEMTRSEDKQFEMNLQFAEKRMDEISELVQAGDKIPLQLFERLQQHFDFASKLADFTSDPMQSKQQIQEQLQNQQQTMNQLHQYLDVENDAVLLRTQEMLRDRLRIIQNEQDPQNIQNQNQLQNQQQLNQDSNKPEWAEEGEFKEQSQGGAEPTPIEEPNSEETLVPNGNNGAESGSGATAVPGGSGNPENGDGGKKGK